LDIHGGADDVVIDVVTQMPFLEFVPNSNERGRWTITVPDDWIAGTNLVTNILWSPANTNTGNVFWFGEYKSVAVGSLVSGANMAQTYLQAGPGVAYQLAETGNNLFISGASMTAGALLQLVIGRSGGAATDTKTGNVHVHHVRVEYMAKKLL
jgi:hypothetical protein